MVVEAAPALLGGGGQPVDHGHGGEAGAAPLGLTGPMADRGEGRLDGIGRAQVDPVGRREVVEGEERVFALALALAGLG